MTQEELYKMIKLPEGAAEQLREYEKQRDKEIPDDIKDKLFCRATWDEGTKQLQQFLGEDPYFMNILWEQLNFVCTYSYEEYKKRGISDEIFADTFGFVTRFVSGTKDANGKYRYDWAWWLQRQITLQEFRIGSLEFEFVEAFNHREVEIHIPSDADMNLNALCRSILDFVKFEEKYMPDWCNVAITTDTWMIMPELPEKTTLHRKLKEHLLSGKKFGIAKGHLVMDRVRV